jgi:hypothetical protein
VVLATLPRFFAIVYPSWYSRAPPDVS